MLFYALGITPIIDFLRMKIPNVKNVSLADDITGAGKISDIKVWWNLLITEGKKYGYVVNEHKSWLIAKDSELLELSKTVFCDSAIKFTKEGKKHLGAALGSENFREKCAKENFCIWCKELVKLSEYAKIQPHAAYAAFRHGEIHKYTFFLRTIPGMEEYIKPLDDLLTQKFIPYWTFFFLFFKIQFKVEIFD